MWLNETAQLFKILCSSSIFLITNLCLHFFTLFNWCLYGDHLSVKSANVSECDLQLSWRRMLGKTIANSTFGTRLWFVDCLAI